LLETFQGCRRTVCQDLNFAELILDPSRQAVAGRESEYKRSKSDTLDVAAKPDASRQRDRAI